jgi:hypothetical protein
VLADFGWADAVDIGGIEGSRETQEGPTQRCVLAWI